MPDQVLIYQTRTMLEALQSRPSVPTFFRKMLGPKVKTFPTSKVDIDFRKSRRQMATYVDPNNPVGTPVEREGFVTLTYETPMLKEVRVLSLPELSERVIGETIYSQRTAAERAAEYLRDDLDYLDRLITRAEEYQWAQALLTGSVSTPYRMSDGTVNSVSVSLGTPNTTTLASGAKWTSANFSAGTANPFSDLKTAFLQVLQNGYIAPDTVLMSTNVLNNFKALPNISNLFWPERWNLGEFNPTVLGDGVVFQGTLRDPMVDIFTYDSWNVDPVSGTEAAVVPNNIFVMFKRQDPLFQTVYGSVTQLEGVPGSAAYQTYQSTRVPQVYDDIQKGKKFIALSSRPLPAIPDFNRYAIFTVL